MSAGCFWGLGGLFLLIRAGLILRAAPATPLWPGVVGLAVAYIKHRLVFSKVVAANLRRIKALSPHKDKICLFAFQSIESYLFVIVMVSLGLALRFLGIPPAILAAVYFAVGFALAFSSGLYFRAMSRV